MDMRERLLAALGGGEPDRPPCASPLQTGTLDLMEASGAWWPEAHRDAATMAELALAAHTVAGIESVRVPFDVSMDASAFGAVTGMETVKRHPAILERPITSEEELSAARVPDPFADGRAPVVLGALERLSPRLEGVPLIFATVSPFMLACQLRGDEMAIMDVAYDPDFLKGILDLAARWNIEFSRAAIAAGADVVTMVDATSSGTILSPQQYEEFALPYQRRVAAAIAAEGARSVLHICGETHQNLDLMAEVGADGISVDQVMDIAWVVERLRGSCAVLGNVSPTTTLLSGSPAEVASETRRCIDAGTDVLCPGCGFASETPLENMRAMVRATLERA